MLVRRLDRFADGLELFAGGDANECVRDVVARQRLRDESRCTRRSRFVDQFAAKVEREDRDSLDFRFGDEGAESGLGDSHPTVGVVQRDVDRSTDDRISDDDAGRTPATDPDSAGAGSQRPRR